LNAVSTARPALQIVDSSFDLDAWLIDIGPDAFTRHWAAAYQANSNHNASLQATWF
jgi:hypothetical protein